MVGLYIISSLRRPGTTSLIQGGALIASLPLYYFAIRAWDMTGGALVSSATYMAVLGCGVAIIVANSSVRLRDLVPGPADARALRRLRPQRAVREDAVADPVAAAGPRARPAHAGRHAR